MLSYKIYFPDNFDCRKVVCMFCLVLVAILAFTANDKVYQENFLIFLGTIIEYDLSTLKGKPSITVNVFGNIDLFCLSV